MSAITECLGIGRTPPLENQKNSKTFYFALLIIVATGSILSFSLGLCGYLKLGLLSDLSKLHSVALIIGGSSGVCLSASFFLKFFYPRAAKILISSRDSVLFIENSDTLPVEKQIGDPLVSEDVRNNLGVEETHFPSSLSKEPPIKAEIYIASCSAFPIRLDRRFCFAQRIKNLDGSSVKIEETDYYIEIKGKFEGNGHQQLLDLIAEQVFSLEIYLPSSLLTNVKEGETIRFLYGDRLVELCCQQKNNPILGKLTFEEALQAIKEISLRGHLEAQFDEDIPPELLFKNHIIGHSLTKIDASGVNSKIENLDIYRNDEKMNGRYQELGIYWTYRSQKGNTICLVFNLFGIQLSEVDLILSKGINNLQQLWIFIPHRPEQNQFPENADVLHVNWGKENEKNYCRPVFDPEMIFWQPEYRHLQYRIVEVFDPQKGHRLGWYKYGCYYMHPLKGNETFKISINQNWLQLVLSIDS